MSSSGLIYAVIVGAWAAYLVPMWLRRQDELNEARPTERFSTAIRLLSGRGAMERRYARSREAALDEDGEAAAADESPEHVDVRDRAVPLTEIGLPAPAAHGTGGHGTPGHPAPAHPAGAHPHGPGPHGAAPHAGGPHAGAGHPSAAHHRPANAARAKVLARRRRTTTLLFLAFTAGAIGAAVGGLGYLWAPAAPGALLTSYIVHLRRVEQRRFTFTMDQRRAAEAARRLREHPRPALPAAPEPAEEPSARTAGRRALVEQTDHAEWVAQQADQAIPEDGWAPVPVPLPTYVTAPVAPRTASGADLAAADPWSAARSSAAAPETAPQPRRPRDRDRTPLFDQYAHPPLPADLDRPRAANE